MTKRIGYRWKLREEMAHRGMWSTTDLAPLLIDRGIDLSPAQIYRLVAGTPERLSLAQLAAICDALSCSPNDLIEVAAQPVVTSRPKKRAASGETGPLRPRRARVVREQE